MSEPQKKKYKYPIQVYESLRIEPRESKFCSDPEADYQLCKAGFFFNGVTHPLPNESLYLEFPESKFDYKESSTGMKFYRAKQSKSCEILRKVFKICDKRLKLVKKGHLIGHLGEGHDDHLTSLGLEGVNNTISK